MRRFSRMATPSRGFTLIEVLISVVIFSVGLLGLAGLQATGIKMNHSSLLRSQATLLAYDIVDCMRANKAAATSANYNIAMDASDSSAGGLPQADVNGWLANLDRLLPSGDGSISVDAAARATVVVRWDDARTPDQLTTMTLISDI